MGMQAIVDFLDDWLEFARLRPYVTHLWRSLVIDRKGAAVVNREFLDWLSQREQPERPFLAFLNYFDAHYPYQLTPGRLHRFGVEPTDIRQPTTDPALVGSGQDGVSSRRTWRLSPMLMTIASPTSMSSSGSLLDELERRGVLERTWLIIASDHGESFGDHAGIFCHGSSLYQSEVHVPLLIIPPGGSATKQVVTEPVSLRDLAATIVDVLGLESGSPFPGSSLARFWDGTGPAAPPARVASDAVLAEVVPNDPSHLDAAGLPRKTWPLGALIEGEWSYIRREGDLREELFHLRGDAKEQRNLAGEAAVQPRLERMRAALGRLTAGPLSPQRFSR